MRFVLTETGPDQPNSNHAFRKEQLCFHEHLEQLAAKNKHNTAVICGNASLTYEDLNSLANGFARILVENGLEKGDLVGVALDRSVDLIAALIAVWKTGAAFVPIDPSLPIERIAQMTDDACPKLIITGPNVPGELTSRTAVPCLPVNEAHSSMTSDFTSISNLEIAVEREDLGYVMYTSGSTGRPKGVEIQHSSVSNLLLSMQNDPGCHETDRVLAITTISFDMSIPELFLPLFCGATTVIAQRDEIKDMHSLVELIRRHKITIMQGTPAIWQMMLDSGWNGQPRLQKILCGGEALSHSLAQRLLSCCDAMWNLYGPTEATVYASIWRVREGQDVMIGSAITNGHLYILDEQLAPVPRGNLGELCIGGAGVARGYRNRTELSLSKFVANPFHKGLMYRTGDVARFVEPGMVCVLGRADGQVKIRGHRIELSEIEAAITTHKDFSGAAVVCRDDRLAAYYVLKPKASAAHNPGTTMPPPSSRTLRSWLQARLPAYMVPAFFIEMDSFPVTSNGKIDRNSLPDPVTIPKDMPVAAKSTTDLEGSILAIWVRVLEHNQISIDDSFFEVGGNSLRLVRVQKDLEEFLGYSIKAAALFEHYTIKMLAAHLTNSNDAKIHHHKDNLGLHKEDIAIIAMACRLPGGISTPQDFWELLEQGNETITEVPEGRWNTLSSDKTPFCRCGGFLSSPISSFDLSIFGISPREAKRLDPSQYLMLETCWEGFERAGYAAERLRDSSTGVFIGTSNILSHQGLNLGVVRDCADLDGYTVTGSAAATMSGRISYYLGLQGPTMTIDTACSSSLVSTHLACNALRLGECDMAIAGGVSLMTNPGLHAEFSQLQGMSPDGRCRSFSADTEGTGWSEGSAVVILKRLSDAQRDGDIVHALIPGSAVNHDGRSASLTTPSGHAQQRLIRTALTAAQLQPADIDYIEAHGTGTRLGDPIEATALANVFGPDRFNAKPLYIGSSKSNIGHTQAAAGLVGVLKVVLSLQRAIIPQTLHITEPTPGVDWKSANMEPVLCNRPWTTTENLPRRAGVSAFGIGGTNAHVLIQEAPKIVKEPGNSKLTAHKSFLISGESDATLRMQVEKLHAHVRDHINEELLGDLAYSLATHRTHLQKRIALKAHDRNQLLHKLESAIRPDTHSLFTSNKVVDTPKMAMLFTGQGSQWLGMGKSMCEHYPVFAAALNEIANEFNIHLKRPLLEVMWAASDGASVSLIDRTDFAQPALFALETAFWRLWKSWGVSSDFLLGHSLGELVAAHVAGVMDLPDACRLVAARGRLMQAQSGDFLMIAIEAKAAEVITAIEEYELVEKIDVALYNTPTQIVISGERTPTETIADHFTSRGRKTMVVVAGHAFHSRAMDGMLADFLAVAQTVYYKPPQLKIVSSLDAQLAKAERLVDPQYWVKQARESVRYSDGIETLIELGVNVFLELGPQPTLCGMGVACIPDSHMQTAITWLPSMNRTDGPLVIQDSISQLHVRHVRVDWQSYFEPYGCQRIDLPTYAFNRTYIQDYNRKEVSSPEAAAIVNENGVCNGIAPNLASRFDRFEFGIKWQSVSTDTEKPQGTWGLVRFANTSPWQIEVIAALAFTGIQCLQIEHLEHDETLEGMICLWDSDSDTMHDTREIIPKALLQLQSAAKLQLTPPLIWITRQAVGTGSESFDEALKPGAVSLLWGLMRTTRSEHPELRLRLVDISEDADKACIASALALNAEPECAIRKDRLLVPRLEHVKPERGHPVIQYPFVRADGAVLITGGLGHLGAEVACWLASVHQVRDLILISRHGLETPGAQSLVTELSTLGSKATIVAADITKPDSLNAVMALFTQERPLRGVIHAAGIVDSGVLASMTPERCETVIAPKMYGAWLLHQATQQMDIDIFVMVSSISGILGMPGLANYAAANTYLDTLAHMRRARGLPATSFALGTLGGEGGMASKLSQNTQSHLSEFGLDPLSLSTGLELLSRAVLSKRALTVAAALDLQKLDNFLQQHDGTIPPLLSLLLTRVNPSAKLSPRRLSLHNMLRNAKTADHPGVVLDMVRQVVAKALGFSHPSEVEVDRPLKDIGIDSLTAVQMRNHLANLTGLRLSVNIAFSHPSLRMLSQSLLDQLQDTKLSSTAVETANRINVAAIRKGCLDSSIKFEDSTAQGFSNSHGRRLGSALLTGATGFVGAYILHELLKRGITSYCLVRCNSIEQAQQRLTSTLRQHGLFEPSHARYIKPLVGNMAHPLLGLSEEQFNDLADRVDAVCHSGALVDWMRPLEDYIGPNVVSAHEILRLASRGRRKDVHLISTISTLPKHLGLELKEGDLEYGYGTSKYLAERMVAAARWRGATASVYRLPYVTASTATGHFRQDRGDFLHNLITGCLELGAFPSIQADLSAVLPVDYLAQTVVAKMSSIPQGSSGQDYDFLNPHAPSCTEFFTSITQVDRSAPSEIIPFSAWKQKASVHIASHPGSPLARIAAVLDNYMDENCSTIFKGLSVGKHVLGGGLFPAPHLGDEFIERYLGRAKSQLTDGLE
jgi:amino acid adenylation domain-containing protein/thioester reductase-like protein